jgi:hypothetical protein
MMREVKRDVAPPGWFERATDFCCGVFLCVFGIPALLLFGMSLLSFNFKDARELLVRLIGFAISGAAVAFGVWFFREWRQ